MVRRAPDAGPRDDTLWTVRSSDLDVLFEQRRDPDIKVSYATARGAEIEETILRPDG